ncbi:MAG: hypothetical protein H0V07_11575 [Propionibacteriales bacterium]|nr:hypothetical protein [Propionibacteriales bacterium]
MKKTAVAAVALASVTALTGASAAPATAPGATQAATAHTLKWKLIETASHRVGTHGFVGTDKIRSRRTGNVVGYDSFTGTFSRRTQSAKIQFAASVKGGILIGQVRADFDSKQSVFHGRVLKGTGKFAGAQGTIVAKPIGDGSNTSVTITYVV